MSSEKVSIASVTKLIYRYPSFYGMEKFDHGVPVIRGEHLNDQGGISTLWTDYWFVSSDYSAKYPKTVLEEHDVVMSVRGSVGTFNRVGKSHVGVQISPNLIRLVPDPKKIYPPFFYYALRNDEVIAQIKGSVASSAVPALKASDIKSAQLHLPAPAVQIEAAETLSAIDDQITLLRETNTTLEAIAQALFKSWFVDFDPVHAKLQGRAPDGMDEATAALFPDSFEESELGAVPKGWSVGDLNALAELNPESWSAKHHPKRILYVDLANTKAGEIDDFNEFSFEDAPSRARRVLKSGDVIVGTVRPGNRSFARIASDIAGLTGSTGFAVLRAREVIDHALIYIAATNDEAIDRLAHLADGGAYPAVRPEVVVSTPMVIAPKAIRNLFGEIANPFFASIGVNQECMRQLASLRDTLLPRLISGQINLAEVATEII